MAFTDFKKHFLIFSLANFVALLNSADPSFGEENRKKLGYDLATTLFSCSYNGEDCNVDEFEWYFDLNLGNCFRFNSGKDSYGNQTKIKESVCIISNNTK